MARELIFVSSVQKELADERRALAAFVRGHPLLQRFFDVFLFEELPATDRRADDLYLGKVDAAAVYVGLLGREYGTEGAEGRSPIERPVSAAAGGRRLHAEVRLAAAIAISVGADGHALPPKRRSRLRPDGSTRHTEIDGRVRAVCHP